MTEFSDINTQTSSVAKIRLKMRIAVTTGPELIETLVQFNDEKPRNNEGKNYMRRRLRKLCNSNPSAAEFVLLRDMTVRCSYKYICVIDFEATCIDTREFYPHEIIEFPAVLIDVGKLAIIDSFHSFVKPTLVPELTTFCKKFTGISQETVNKAETFETVLESFLGWLGNYCGSGKTVSILTDGSCDIDKFLSLQCLISRIDFPACAKHWIDIKSVYEKSYKLEKTRLTDMLHSFGMSFKGRQHSGKDDAHNIAELTISMLKDGCKFKAFSTLSQSKRKTYASKIETFKKARQCKEKKVNLNIFECNKEKSSKKDAMYSKFVMDVDPELVGTESTLSMHKYKSKVA